MRKISKWLKRCGKHSWLNDLLISWIKVLPYVICGRFARWSQAWPIILPSRISKWWERNCPQAYAIVSYDTSWAGKSRLTSPSRRRRIANGSGNSFVDANNYQRLQSLQMIGKFVRRAGKMMLNKQPNTRLNMPGGGGMPDMSVGRHDNKVVCRYVSLGRHAGYEPNVWRWSRGESS